MTGMPVFGINLHPHSECATGMLASDACLGSEVVSLGETTPLISKWGGPRENSGGRREGSGRPRKPAPTQPVYAPDTPRWCVLAFWGQAERSATTELARSGYETYMPMVAIRRRDPVILTQWHIARVPYLPGYGFIRLTQTESREPITATRGVREVLRRPDGRAASVSDAEIARMQAGDDKRLELPKVHGTVLAVASMVRVEDGPFAAHPGRVTECDGVKTCVELNIFGRATPVWLDRVSVVQI